MAGCASCEALREYGANFILNGITNKECNSLKNNTGINPDLSVLHKNCEDLQDINACIQQSLLTDLRTLDVCSPNDLKQFLEQFLTNFTVTNDAIICSDCGAWIEIGKIWAEIQIIWEAIRSISLGGIYTTLPDSEYTITTYNGFYTRPDNIQQWPVRLQYYEIQGFYYIQTSTNVTGFSGANQYYYYMQHDNVREVSLRHADDPSVNTACWMYSINFRNSFAFLNNYRLTSASSSAGQGVWNLANSSGQAFGASWGVGVTHFNAAATGNGQWCTVCPTSTLDGYNTQWTRYNENPIRTAGINCVSNLIAYP